MQEKKSTLVFLQMFTTISYKKNDVKGESISIYLAQTQILLTSLIATYSLV